jgi:hypothetical protein
VITLPEMPAEQAASWRGPLLAFGGNSPSGHQAGVSIPHLARVRPDTGRRRAALPLVMPKGIESDMSLMPV